MRGLTVVLFLALPLGVRAECSLEQVAAIEDDSKIRQKDLLKALTGADCRTAAMALLNIERERYEGHLRASVLYDIGRAAHTWCSGICDDRIRSWGHAALTDYLAEGHADPDLVPVAESMQKFLSPLAAAPPAPPSEAAPTEPPPVVRIILAEPTPTSATAPDEAWKRPRWLVPTLAVSALITGVVGGYFAIEAWDRQDAVDALDGADPNRPETCAGHSGDACRAYVQGIQDDRDEARLPAVILGATTGALLLGAGGLLLWTDPESDTAFIHPLPSGAAGGLRITF